MLIIGIAGGSGSGKTTVVKKILNRMPIGSVAFISQDSYYKANSHLTLEQRRLINFDHPDSIEFSLLARHLHDLKNGHAIQEPIYSYLECTRKPGFRLVEPREVVIVDGILLLSMPEIRELIDIKVFVDADGDDRLSRCILRDVLERGRTVEDVLKHYYDTVKPMHIQFIEPSKRFADLVIPQGGANEIAIEVLTHSIEKHLAK